MWSFGINTLDFFTITLNISDVTGAVAVGTIIICAIIGLCTGLIVQNKNSQENVLNAHF